MKEIKSPITPEHLYEFVQNHNTIKKVPPKIIKDMLKATNAKSAIIFTFDRKFNKKPIVSAFNMAVSGIDKSIINDIISKINETVVQDDKDEEIAMLKATIVTLMEQLDRKKSLWRRIFRL